MSGVDSWVKGFLAGERQQTILVVAGPAASGKSLFVRKLIDQVMELGGDPSNMIFHHVDERVVTNAMADNNLVVFEEVAPSFVKGLLFAPTVRVEALGKNPTEEPNKASIIFLTQDENVDAKVETLRFFTFATVEQAGKALFRART